MIPKSSTPPRPYSQTPRRWLGVTNAWEPVTPGIAHVEELFGAAESVRDVIIGMPGGLTVPFAVASDLAGALPTTNVLFAPGLVEIAVGSSAIGLGGYLAVKADAMRQPAERRRWTNETTTLPEAEREVAAEVFRNSGVPEEQISDGPGRGGRAPGNLLLPMAGKHVRGVGWPDASWPWISFVRSAGVPSLSQKGVGGRSASAAHRGCRLMPHPCWRRDGPPNGVRA